MTCRQELELFASGAGISLRDFQTAYGILKRYSLVLLVGRRVEEMHAKIRRASKRWTFASVPCVASTLREQGQIQRLDTDLAFYTFILKHWRSKILYDQLLRWVVPIDSLTLSHGNKNRTHLPVRFRRGVQGHARGTNNGGPLLSQHGPHEGTGFC